MPKGSCPSCDELVEITKTDIALEYVTDESFNRVPKGSARRWQVVVHPDRRVEPDLEGRRPICLGSGRMI